MSPREQGGTWFYDRQGKPLSIEDADPRLGDPNYKRVAEDTIGPYWVSTVWIGIDMGFMRGGPPIIFETMVFAHTTTDSKLGPPTDYCDRYATEEQALAGHEAICTLIRATIDETIPSEETHSDTEH